MYHDLDEVLDQVRELLQSKGRVTYRSLKRASSWMTSIWMTSKENSSALRV